MSGEEGEEALCLVMMKSGGDRRKSTLGDHMKKLQRRYYRTLQHNGRLGEVHVHDHAGTVQPRKTFPSRGWSELPAPSFAPNHLQIESLLSYKPCDRLRGYHYSQMLLNSLGRGFLSVSGGLGRLYFSAFAFFFSFFSRFRTHS